MCNKSRGLYRKLQVLYSSFTITNAYIKIHSLIYLAIHNLYICIHISTHTHTHIYVCVRVCVYVWWYIYIYIYVCVCAYIYIYISTTYNYYLFTTNLTIQLRLISILWHHTNFIFIKIAGPRGQVSSKYLKKTNIYFKMLLFQRP